MSKDLWAYGLDGTSRHVHNKSCASDCKKNLGKFNLGYSLIKFIAQDSTNKLDSREQTINGVEVQEYFSPEMNQALGMSRFKRLRKQLGKKLSMCGKVAVVVDIIEGKPYISISEITNYTKVAGTLVEFIGDTGRVIEEKDCKYPIYERWYLEDGLVKKMFAFKVEEEWVLEEGTEPFIYPANITVIPVHIFENNEDGVSDVANVGMWGAIEELNYHANQLTPEWDMIKTAFLRNAMFDPGKTAAEFEKEKANGGMINTTSPDGQLGNALGALISGSQTPLLNQTNINFIEDKILKYTFTTRDSISTGTNKHNAEIATFNQFAIEYLIDKLEIRQEDYAHFYAILGMFDGKEFNPADVTVEIQISEIVRNLIDASNPETPEVQERINKDETTETNEEE